MRGGTRGSFAMTALLVIVCLIAALAATVAFALLRFERLPNKKKKKL
jgi:hypothetical protein